MPRPRASGLYRLSLSLSIFTPSYCIMPLYIFHVSLLFSANFSDLHVDVHAFMDIHLSFAMTPSNGRARSTDRNATLAFGREAACFPLKANVSTYFSFVLVFLLFPFSLFIKKKKKTGDLSARKKGRTWRCT